jgi:excisionase family DNA binding protein
MLSVKEVGSLFHVSQQTVRKWVKDGELKCFHIGDVFRFSEAHVQEFITANEASRDAR